jgi:hypothetical protein
MSAFDRAKKAASKPLLADAYIGASRFAANSFAPPAIKKLADDRDRVIAFSISAQGVPGRVICVFLVLARRAKFAFVFSMTTPAAQNCCHVN